MFAGTNRLCISMVFMEAYLLLNICTIIITINHKNLQAIDQIVYTCDM